MPPDFKLAEIHGETSLVKNFGAEMPEDNDTPIEELYCPCCGMPTFKAAPKYSVCVSTKKLESLGSGFPMFYSFKRFVFYVFFLMFLLVGAYSIIISLVTNKGHEWITIGTPAWMVRFSIGSLGATPSAFASWRIILNLVFTFFTTLVLLICTICMRRSQH